MRIQRNASPRKRAFSLLELILVLGIVAILAGTGSAGLAGIRKLLAAEKSRILVMEIGTACRLYRMDHGDWPEPLLGGEQTLDPGPDSLLDDLAPYLERPDLAVYSSDSHGNGPVYVVADVDGDHWIRSTDFSALPERDRPGEIRARTAVYSLDPEGRLAEGSWEHAGP